MVGAHSPNFSGFPDANARTTFSFSWGKLHQSDSIHWENYYNHPSLGIAFFYSHLGSSILGHEFALVPNITLNFSKKKQKSFYTKVGLGLGYATNPFDSIGNPGNEILGAHWNWVFQLFAYRTLLLNNRWHVKLGVGFLHSSNSHTELPNFGLNSFMGSLSFQRYARSIRTQTAERELFLPNRDKIYFWQVVTGIGLHELGGTRRPINGPDKVIPSISITGGIVFKQHFKTRFGLSYRYYDSFRDDIVNNELPQFQDRPVWNASHLFVTVGGEYLVGHIGLDLEVGITLHKPYFNYWFDRNEEDGRFARWQNKTFATRLGGNFYLRNTNKNPASNVFVGLHVNANWGTADFMSYALGYTRRIR